MPIASPVAQAEVSGWPAGQDNPALETAVDMAESFELDQSILRGDEERVLTTTGSVEVGAWTDAEAETASNERSTSEPFEF